MFVTIIIFILILSLLVFVHEFGHFIVSRKLGVKVDEFGIGFPPRAIGVYKNRSGKWITVIGNKKVDDIPTTLYSLNWFPLGGFCSIKGENGEHANEADSFGSKKIWKRIAIVSAGVTMNFILAAVLLGIGFMIGLPQEIKDDGTKTLTIKNPQIQVMGIVEKSPAELAGLATGDTILSVGGNEVFSISEINEIITKNGEIETDIKIKRNDAILEKKITPTLSETEGRVLMGVSLVKTGTLQYPWYKAIYMGFATAFDLLKAILVAFYTIIRDLIIGVKVETDVAGPIGIAVLTGKVVDMGLIYVIQFAALLSLNLAVINFLPIPALDGGRVVFLVLEKIRGKAVNPRIENIIHMTGFALLMLLVILVTVNDISKFSEMFIGLFNKIKNIF